jgi:hypothetical protein
MRKIRANHAEKLLRGRMHVYLLVILKALRQSCTLTVETLNCSKNLSTRLGEENEIPHPLAREWPTPVCV